MVNFSIFYTRVHSTYITIYIILYNVPSITAFPFSFMAFLSNDYSPSGARLIMLAPVDVVARRGCRAVRGWPPGMGRTSEIRVRIDVIMLVALSGDEP